ncbi:hypothetical protein AAY473_016859 [Plecturocebus cupreus]
MESCQGCPQSLPLCLLSAESSLPPGITQILSQEASVRYFNTSSSSPLLEYGFGSVQVDALSASPLSSTRAPGNMLDVPLPGSIYNEDVALDNPLQRICILNGGFRVARQLQSGAEVLTVASSYHAGTGSLMEPLITEETVLLSFGGPWVPSSCPPACRSTKAKNLEHLSEGLASQDPDCAAASEVHLTPATSTILPMFDPSKIMGLYLRCTSGEVGAMSDLDPLDLSVFKQVGDNITKPTSD